MDPYLERHSLWKEIHTGLIVGIQRFLNPLLRPHYRVAIEQRNYLALLTPDDELVGIPDLLLIPQQQQPQPLSWPALADVATVEPLVGELPVPEEVRERFLEIRDTQTQEIVTVIEILSPTNKITRDGRKQAEPILLLNQILHTIYEEGSYDLAIDYTTPPTLPLSPENQQWVAALLAAKNQAV